MAKDKQIQELEIRISTTGDKVAENKLDRLLSKRERLAKKEIDIKNTERKLEREASNVLRAKDRAMRKESILRTKLRSESLKDIRVRKALIAADREGIKLSRKRFKITPQYSMFNTMRNDPRSKSAIQKRVLDNLAKSEAVRSAVSGRGGLGRKVGSFSSLQGYQNRIIQKNKTRDRVLTNLVNSESKRGSGLNKFNIPTDQSITSATTSFKPDFRQRVEQNIARYGASKGSGSNKFNVPVTAQNSMFAEQWNKKSKSTTLNR